MKTLNQICLSSAQLPVPVEKISQADLCPTLAVLAGVPVPVNSIGNIVSDALVGLSVARKLDIVKQNADNAMGILQRYVTNIEKGNSSKNKDFLHLKTTMEIIILIFK